MRHPSFAFALVLVAISASSRAGAQTPALDWPSRPVRVIAPYAAGGLTDIMARVTAEKLSAIFGQPFVVENRPGAGGSIGTEYAVRQPPDGYSLYFGAGAQITVLPLTQKVNYDALTQLAPIGIVGVNGNICGVHPSLPVKTLGDFVNYVRARPGKVNYGITGIGTISHLVPATLVARTKLDMVQVPYQGSSMAMNDLMSGVIQMYCTSASGFLPYAGGDKLRLLGITSEARLAGYPDLPAFAETFPGFVFTTWDAYFAPTGTPGVVIDRMTKAIATIAKDESVIKRFAEMGIETVATTPEETAEVIRREIPVLEEAVNAAGLRRKD